MWLLGHMRFYSSGNQNLDWPISMKNKTPEALTRMESSMLATSVWVHVSQDLKSREEQKQDRRSDLSAKAAFT